MNVKFVDAKQAKVTSKENCTKPTLQYGIKKSAQKNS